MLTAGKCCVALVGCWNLWWTIKSVWWNDYAWPKTTCQVYYRVLGA